MYKIIDKEWFSENVAKFEVEAPLIAHARRPGHFVIESGRGVSAFP